MGVRAAKRGLPPIPAFGIGWLYPVCPRRANLAIPRPFFIPAGEVGTLAIVPIGVRAAKRGLPPIPAFGIGWLYWLYPVCPRVYEPIPWPVPAASIRQGLSRKCRSVCAPQSGDCHQFPPLELAGCTRFAHARAHEHPPSPVAGFIFVTIDMPHNRTRTGFCLCRQVYCWPCWSAVLPRNGSFRTSSTTHSLGFMSWRGSIGRCSSLTSPS